ncbi:hypothetical protein [Halobacillus ihumii]|uniref:hypothetical protein n=1 Tax=Halobacillus ihumii TaxID=2686092 RepID=UPI0013D32A33|nr:hypothetical protein [Halobacillus ihumii]
MSRPQVFEEKCVTCEKVVNEAPEYEGAKKFGNWYCDNCKPNNYYIVLVDGQILMKEGTIRKYKTRKAAQRHNEFLKTKHGRKVEIGRLALEHVEEI